MTYGELRPKTLFRLGSKDERVWMVADRGERLVVVVCVSPACVENHFYKRMPQIVQERGAIDPKVEELGPESLRALGYRVLDDEILALCQRLEGKGI